MTKEFGLLEQLAIEAISDIKNYFLISCTVHNHHIKIVYDADAPGVLIDDLALINKKIRKSLELLDAYKDGNFSLEVTSYGIDNPIQLPRQYKKFINKSLEIVLIDGSVLDTRLLSVSDTHIVIEKNGIQKNKIQETILISDIQKSFYKIKF